MGSQSSPCVWTSPGWARSCRASSVGWHTRTWIGSPSPPAPSPCSPLWEEKKNTMRNKHHEKHHEKNPCLWSSRNEETPRWPRALWGWDAPLHPFPVIKQDHWPAQICVSREEKAKRSRLALWNTQSVWINIIILLSVPTCNFTEQKFALVTTLKQLWKMQVCCWSIWNVMLSHYGNFWWGWTCNHDRRVTISFCSVTTECQGPQCLCFPWGDKKLT